MIKKSHLATLLAASLSLAATEALATVYKWKDEKGVTHYTENPPPDSVKKVETLQVKSRASSDATSSIDQLNKDRDRSEQSQSEKKTVDEGKSEARNEKYKEKCDRLKKDQGLINSGATIRLKEGDNERVLSEQEKQDRLDQTQRELKAYCE